MNEIEKLSAELVETAKLLYERNYICAGEGNLSVRLDDNRVIITPAGLNKGRLRKEDLVICDMNGEPEEKSGKPSTEIKIHLVVYRMRGDVKAVCHAHPVYATSCSVSGIALNQPILPEMIIGLGAVPLVPYATPGTDKLADNLTEYLDRYDAFLLENHGAVTLGKSCREAFDRMEMVERYANILYIAMQAGGPKLLSSDETSRLLEAAEKSKIKPDLECL